MLKIMENRFGELTGRPIRFTRNLLRSKLLDPLQKVPQHLVFAPQQAFQRRAAPQPEKRGIYEHLRRGYRYYFAESLCEDVEFFAFQSSAPFFAARNDK